MKKFLVSILLVGLLSGCGSNTYYIDEDFDDDDREFEREEYISQDCITVIDPDRSSEHQSYNKKEGDCVIFVSEDDEEWEDD